MNVVWARNAARSGAWWPGLIQDLTHAPVGVLNQILAYGDNSGYFIRFVGPPSTSNGPDYSTSKVEQMPWDDAGSQHKAILSVSNEADARAQRQAILEIHNVLSPQLARSQVIQVPSSQPVNLLVPQQQGAVTLHPHAMSIPLPIVLQQATTAHGSGVSSSNPAQSMHRPVTVQQQLIPRVSGAVHVLLQPGNRPASSGVLQQPQPSLEQQGQALLKGYEQRLRHLHAQVLNPEGRTCFFAEMQR
ncbi:hypothetical protein CEUSTIGMA_g3502.t1 [Chlamydomonas eustigma]|uniref:PWWP domain-containing protein n=1 Tax=Chlamydomonas eustigma TaxID=1157962 RepID=A0A250WZD5_9CHLO|nr:hypothetical protein CEUSTIGMA_g3502.t1 [Chlamydomonas eustigma]|eukprot:GAX76059.1 hypothetical protein CEUSTIGMA_g3502.t1 [Chlamydomonas eustigma]